MITHVSCGEDHDSCEPDGDGDGDGDTDESSMVMIYFGDG